MSSLERETQEEKALRQAVRLNDQKQRIPGSYKSSRYQSVQQSNTCEATANGTPDRNNLLYSTQDNGQMIRVNLAGLPASNPSSQQQTGKNYNGGRFSPPVIEYEGINISSQGTTLLGAH